MSESLFDGLEASEEAFTLPNGKAITLFPLNIYQRLDISAELQELTKRSAKRSDMIEVCKKAIKLAVLNNDYEPYLTDRELNKLAIIQGGNLISKIFGRVMDISGATDEAWKSAEKKPKTRE